MFFLVQASYVNPSKCTKRNGRHIRRHRWSLGSYRFKTGASGPQVLWGCWNSIRCSVIWQFWTLYTINHLDMSIVNSLSSFGLFASNHSRGGLTFGGKSFRPYGSGSISFRNSDGKSQREVKLPKWRQSIAMTSNVSTILCHWDFWIWGGWTRC